MSDYREVHEQAREVKQIHTIGGVMLRACMDCDATWRQP